MIGLDEVIRIPCPEEYSNVQLSISDFNVSTDENAPPPNEIPPHPLLVSKAVKIALLALRAPYPLPLVPCPTFNEPFNFIFVPGSTRKMA